MADVFFCDLDLFSGLSLPQKKLEFDPQNPFFSEAGRACRLGRVRRSSLVEVETGTEADGQPQAVVSPPLNLCVGHTSVDGSQSHLSSK